jgi:hypothetical protein
MKTETIAWEHKFDHGVRPMTIEHNRTVRQRTFVQMAARLRRHRHEDA